MQDNTPMRPSYSLPSGWFDRLAKFWETITWLLALPAIGAGFSKKNGRRRIGVFLSLLLLLVIPLAQVGWIGRLEDARQLMLARLPITARSLFLDPVFGFAILTVAYVLVIAINREWSRNELRREQYWNVLDANGWRALPDLRMWGLTTPVLLIAVVPLWLHVLNNIWCNFDQICLFADQHSILDYALFSLGTAVSHLVPSELGLTSELSQTENSGTIGAIEFVIAVTVQFGLIFTLIELNRIRKISLAAIDALVKSTDSAAAVGTRILPKLEEVVELSEQRSEKLPKNFFKNAAWAIGIIGGSDGIDILKRLTGHSTSVVNVVVQAVQALHDQFAPTSAEYKQLVEMLQRLDQQVTDGNTRNSLNEALATYGLKSIRLGTNSNEVPAALDLAA